MLWADAGNLAAVLMQAAQLHDVANVDIMPTIRDAAQLLQTILHKAQLIKRGRNDLGGFINPAFELLHGQQFAGDHADLFARLEACKLCIVFLQVFALLANGLFCLLDLPHDIALII